jgi:spermidine synthase
MPLRTRIIGFLLSLCAVTTTGFANEIYQEKSLYRNIIVFEEDGLRCMKFGNQNSGRQTCIFLKNPDALVFNYTKMLLGSLYLKQMPKKVLVIGLGGGTIPMTLQKIYPNVQIDCVEIDPAVVNVAKRYFGFAPGKNTNVFVEDGRVHVKKALKQNRKYDLIILDAFDQIYVPEHMTTREFLLEVRGLLQADGVLGANTYSNSRLYSSESATYFATFGAFYNLVQTNRVVLARNDGLPGLKEIERNADGVEEKLRVFGVGKAWLIPLFTTDVSWPAGTRILTDQYSPANLLNGRR